ncbi:MAG: metallophosphoesterase family protein, partial [Candidatus Dojkabacteria bacterium]
MKLLHISDIHFGAKFTWLENAAQEHRERIWRTFAKAKEHCMREKIDLLLLTGDIFDSPFPAKGSKEILAKEFRELANSGVKIVILPGNHDLLETGSVWQDKAWSEIEGVFVFRNSEEKVFSIEGLAEKVSIIGNAVADKKTRKSPLVGLEDLVEKLRREEEASYIIAMAHGALDILGKGGNRPIQKEEIEQLGADYLALGDWHGVMDVSQGEQTAWYAGSLEYLNREQENSGFGVQVKLSRGDDLGIRAEVNKIKFSELTLEKLEINLEQFGPDNTPQLKKEVELKADKNKIFQLKISGGSTNSLALSKTVSEIERELTD